MLTEDIISIKMVRVLNAVPYCPVAWESDELAQRIENVRIFAV